MAVDRCARVYDRYGTIMVVDRYTRSYDQPMRQSVTDRYRQKLKFSLEHLLVQSIQNILHAVFVHGFEQRRMVGYAVEGRCRGLF